VTITYRLGVTLAATEAVEGYPRVRQNTVMHDGRDRHDDVASADGVV
jgi:hypothetical protein